MEKSYYEQSGIRLLTAENSAIGEENGFPVLMINEDGAETRRGVVEVKRAFPLECPARTAG